VVTIQSAYPTLKSRNDDVETLVVRPWRTSGMPGAVEPFALLTNHGLALLFIAAEPRARIRDIAAAVDITERAAQRIVGDLVRADYLHRTRDGRRNVYTVRTERAIALPGRRQVQLGDLLGVLLAGREHRRTAYVANGR